MKVQVEELSPIERKLSIEVEPAKVEEELGRAYSLLGRQVKIAGFRPGKIPRRILEQRFREQVEDDVVRRVVERAYLDAVRENNLDAVGSPQVTPGTLKQNQPFTFQARVEVKPKLEPKDYQALPLKKPELKVDEAKVTERIEQIRNQLGRLEPIEDRDVAKSGDYAIVDYEATIDGKPFAGSKAENVTVEIAPGEIAESKMAALDGVKVGDSKEIDYAFPADYQVDEVKGKMARFKIHVKGIKKSVTPEANDDLSKEVGGGNTLGELKAKIRSDLERAQKSQAEQDERNAIFKQLVERNAFEAPKAMVDRAIVQMLDGALRMLARSGVDPRQLNLDFGRLREEMRDKAILEVKGALLLEAIAEKEKISPSDDEVNKRIDELVQEQPSQGPAVRKHFRDADARRGLYLRLREEKTIEFLKSHARYS